MRRWLIALLILAAPASADGPWGSGPWHRSGVYNSGLHGGPAAPPVGDQGCGSPPGTPSVWLDARSVDGADNATLANNDPIATWQDLGSIGDDPAQATGGAQPAFIASCINSLPCVRFDGGDRLAATTAANYAFLHNGTGATIYSAAKTTASANAAIVATATGGTSSRGVVHRYSTSFRPMYTMSDGVALQVNLTGDVADITDSALNIMASRLVNEATPARVYINGVESVSGGTATFSATASSSPMNIGTTVSGAVAFTGDITQILIYADAHDDTEQAAVKTWIECIYGEMPVS